MKKYIKFIFIFLIIFCTLVATFNLLFINIPLKKISSNFYNKIEENVSPSVKVEKIILNSDKNNDGILDLDDIVQGGRIDAANKPKYKSAYYQGGYPPSQEGVCTDVIWRALKNAGYDLKAMVDKDIIEHTRDYFGVNGKADPNIDFRRVKNLNVFFKKYADNLTLELKAKDAENLKQWQGGDIVVFGSSGKKEHIAIISDKRRKDGIPYIIHNSGPYTREANDLMHWYPYIIGHYRYPKSNGAISK